MIDAGETIDKSTLTTLVENKVIFANSPLPSGPNIRAVKIPVMKPIRRFTKLDAIDKKYEENFDIFNYLNTPPSFDICNPL
jgi:hypothetical protein